MIEIFPASECDCSRWAKRFKGERLKGTVIPRPRRAVAGETVGLALAGGAAPFRLDWVEG